MVNKILKKAGWLWQDYTGASWNRLNYANTGDGKAGYAYPQGKKSKTAYRPKSLFYHYQVKDIDANHYKINNVKFVLVIGKFNTSHNSFPSVKVFNGDNNAPYKKSAIKTISTPKQLKNTLSGDSYTLEYDLGTLTIDELKDVIVEVDWKKTKVNTSSTISVNRARLVVNYVSKAPKWAVYTEVNNSNPYLNDNIIWKITAKNSGDYGKGIVNLTIPKGITIKKVQKSNGDFNQSNKTWTFNGKKGTSCTLTLTLNMNTVGMKHLKGTVRNDSPNSEITEFENDISCIKNVVATPDMVVGDVENPKDIITYTFYDTFDGIRGYFDVNVVGYSVNHPHGACCLNFYSSNNVILDNPIRDTVELIDNQINVDSIVRDSSVDYDDIHIEIGNNALCLILDNPNDDFVANLRVPFICTDDTEGSVTINLNGDDFIGTFDIIEKPNIIMNCVSDVSKDYSFVQQSIKIGTDSDNLTAHLVPSNKNYFEEKNGEFEISIEDLIAYIGCVPIGRAHQDDLNADTTNSLIDNNYLNRRYLGKEGDYKENIPMTIRLKWADVATLQGLVGMDKPIPIDTCPTLLDGDPINHRGWAEIYGVKNIHKINGTIYECEPEVAYITHDLLTDFNIIKGNKLTDTKIKYILNNIHKYGDNLLDMFNVSYNQFFYNEENTNGDIVGSYIINPMSDLSLTSKNYLNPNSNYSILFSNILPILMSEDYDNNWEMAIRLLNEDNTIVFEHLYNNFKHYDFEHNNILNEVDVTSKVLQSNGDYLIKNHSRIPLTPNEIDASKTLTYFNRLVDIEFDEFDDVVIFLLDKDNNGLFNKTVSINIKSDDSDYSETYYAITDIFGRAILPIKLNNGNYILTFNFDGDDEYQECSYTVGLTVNINETFYYWEYDSINKIDDLNQTYTAKLCDINGDGVDGYSIQYSFADLGSDIYSAEETLVTDENGEVEIPLSFTNGSKKLKVIFKGFVDEHDVVHSPCFFEDVINFGVLGLDTVIEADDVSFYCDEIDHIYYGVLKDKRGNVLANKNVTVGFKSPDNSFVFEKTTDNNGMVSVPLYLTSGNWNATITFKGDNTYKPCYSSKTIKVLNRTQKTSMLIGENLTLNENSFLSDNDNLYTVKLVDGKYKPLSNKPIKICVYNNDKTVKYIETLKFTDIDGKAIVPYIDHNKNIVIETEFLGDNSYKPCSLTDNVICENISGKHDVNVIVEYDVYRYNHGEWNYNPQVKFKYNDSYVDLDYDLIITKYDIHGNIYKCNYEHKEFLEYLELGDYVFTVLVKGDNNYYSKSVNLNVSVEYTYGVIDASVADIKLIGMKINGIDYDSDYLYTKKRMGEGIEVYYGDVISLKLDTNYITNILISDKNTVGTTNTNIVRFNNVSSHVYDIEIPIIIDNYWHVNFTSESPFFSTFIAYDIYLNKYLNIRSKQLSNNDLVDNWDIHETFNTVNINSVTNEHVTIVFVNDDTYESITYSTYINDLNDNKIDIQLSKGNWSYYILGYGKTGYKPIALSNDTIIDTDTSILPDESTIGNLDYSEVVVIPEHTDGRTFGSNIYFELRNNILKFIDYGMVKNKDESVGDIILNDLSLLSGKYKLEVYINYKNTNYNQLHDLEGRIQMDIYEDVLNGDDAKEYSNLLVSPMPIREGITKFTRYTDEGTMYYVKPKDENATFLCNPYIQYKGGTEMTSINGIGLFNLDNGYSPVIVNNGLVSLEFHRRSGYIKISRYDETSEQWYTCNILKLSGSPKLKLANNYTDDSIELNFGSTTWKMWRGRPFIELQNPNDDLRILNLVDRVYCETETNENNMGFVETNDSLYSIFNVHTSIQKIPHIYHVGESIRNDNFELFSVDNKNNLNDLEDDVDLEIIKWDNENSVHVSKNETCNCCVTFSNSPNLIEKTADNMSLLISNIKCLGSNGSIKIKARGFDDKGVVPCKDKIQYGIWEKIRTSNIRYDNQSDSIRVNFYDIPTDVKYLDFSIILSENINEITFNDIMLYEGNSNINYEKDDRVNSARNKEITFEDTYYACLFDEDDNCGLGIARLGQDSFTLRHITKSNDKTILMPYMKVAKSWDNVNNVFIEYINCNEQIVNIDWEQ